LSTCKHRQFFGGFMPPQVPGPGAGPSPIVQQSPAEVEEAKSSDLEKKSAEQQPETSKHDAPKPYRATSKEASNRKAELSTQGTAQQAALNGKLEKKAGQSEKAAQPSVSKEDSKVIDLAKKANAEVMKGMNDAKVIDLAHQANAHVMDGLEKSRSMARQKEAETIATEANRAAHGQPNPEFKKHMRVPLATPEMLAEFGVYSTLKPKFEDSEKVIQKMDNYNRETTAKDRENPKDALPYQVSARSMEKLLGPYGYYTQLSGGPETQQQILDVALHNWRVTPPEGRKALHSRESSPALANGDYSKNWIRPPQTSRVEDERIEKNQVVYDPPLPGAHNIPYQGPRADRPDPGRVWAQAKKDFTDAGFDVINSMGGGVAEAPGKRAAEVSHGRAGRPQIIETRNSTPPPERNVAETQPHKSQQITGSQPEPANQAVTGKPQMQAPKTESKPLKQTGPQGVRDEVAKREINESKVVKSDKGFKPPRKLAEVNKDLNATQNELESLVADRGNLALRDLIREGLDGRELRGTRKQKAHEVEHILNQIVQRGGRRDATIEDRHRAEQAKEYIKQIQDLSSRLNELNEEHRWAKLNEQNEEYAKTR
jgi:hypothetical protein